MDRPSKGKGMNDYDAGWLDATQAERERCAKIADDAHKKVQDVGAAGPYVASEIASRIRGPNN